MSTIDLYSSKMILPDGAFSFDGLGQSSFWQKEKMKSKEIQQTNPQHP